MLRSLVASMQTAGSISAKLGVQPTGARPGVLACRPSLRTSRSAACKRPQRVVTAMSYSTLPEAGPAPVSNRVYTQYGVYKSGGALNFKVIKPNWEYRADGSLSLKDAGAALLEFAPAQANSGTAPGERRYSWDNKTNIALSAAELGDLIDVIGGGSANKSIYHDPNKGRTGEGTEGKSLNINPGTRGNKEIYLNIAHKVRGQPDKKVSIVLNPGEMIVLKRLAEYVIPFLLGFDELFQFDGSMGGPPAGGLGADWSRPPTADVGAGAVPSSAPF